MPGLLDNFRELLKRGTADWNPNLPQIGGVRPTPTFVNPQLVGAGRDMEMALPAIGGVGSNVYAPNPGRRQPPAPPIQTRGDGTFTGGLAPEETVSPAAPTIPAPEFANPYTGRERDPSMAGLDIPVPPFNNPYVGPEEGLSPADAPVLPGRDRIVPGQPVTGDLPTIGAAPVLSALEAAAERVTRSNDPVTDKDKGFKKKLKAFLRESLMGIGEAYKMNSNADWRTLAIGGGGGGLARYALDPTINERRDQEREKAAALEQYKIEAGKAKTTSDLEDAKARRENILADNTAARDRIAQADIRIGQADKRLNQAEQRNADNEYDRGFRRSMAKVKLGYKKGENPQLDEELARHGIDIDQYDANSKTFWQGQNLMTFDENGAAVPVRDGQGEPVTDVTRKPIELEIGGQKFTVSQTVGFQGVASREARQAQLDFEAGKINAREQNDEQQAIVKHSREVSEKILQGEAKQTAADKLRAAAMLIEDPVKQAEALAKAEGVRAEGAALVKQGNELRSQGPPKTKTVTAPKLAKPVSPKRDPLGLFR